MFRGREEDRMMPVPEKNPAPKDEPTGRQPQEEPPSEDENSSQLAGRRGPGRVGDHPPICTSCDEDD